MARKETIPELNLVRGISILAVLMVHATSASMASMKESSLYGAYVFLNTFSLFCVPAFIFLTGFVLFYNYYDKPLTISTVKQFFGKRLMSIVIPYLFISIAYFVLKYFLYYRSLSAPELLDMLGGYLLYGKAYTHLYYVFIIIQFYILFPLLLFLFQRSVWLARLAIPIGFAVQWSFYYLLKQGVLTVPSKGSVSLTYFSPFLIGAFFGMYYPRLKRWLATGPEFRFRGKAAATGAFVLVWLVCASGFVTMWVVTRTGQGKFESYWYEIGYNAFTVLTSIMLLKLSYWIWAKGASAVKNALTDLSSLSFGIYLVHPALLLFYREFPPQTGTSWLHHLWMAGGYALALGGSLIILLAAYRLTKHAWILFGKVPDKFTAPRGKKPEVTTAA